MKDFFISYTGNDKEWAEWIAWHVEEAGYTTIIQAWDIRPSSNFALEMQDGTAETERMIAVLSPDYHKSDYCRAEWAAAFAEDPTGEKGSLLPVRVRECELKGLQKPIVYTDLFDLDEVAAKKTLIAGLKRGRVKPKQKPQFPAGAKRSVPARPPFPPVSALPSIWNVPHNRNPNFTGREDMLEDLRAKLESGEHAALTAISGLGGVGKTQLALEYAYRHAKDYELVWWVRSEKSEELAADYAALAPKIGIEEARDQEATGKAVWDWLSHATAWLLVFDNAPNAEAIKRYTPQAGGHVIVTSREANWRGVAQPLSVKVLKPGESIEFLLKRTGTTDKKAARALADELGHLPLALEQAGAYIAAAACSLDEYLDMYREHRHKLLEDSSPSDDYPETVATTWEISFQKLEEESEAAADLLRLCALFSPDDIPLDVISEGADHLPESLATTVKDVRTLKSAIKQLRHYSMVEVSDGAVSVHRLVQAVTRDRLKKKEHKTWAEVAIKLVNEAYPSGIMQNVQAWPTCKRLLAHAIAATGYAESLKVFPEGMGRLLNQMGAYLHSRAEFADAKAHFEHALKIDENTYGISHPAVARDVNNLGGVLRALGDLNGAKAHYERALKIDEAAYGKNHPSVATLVNNLGGVLEALGDLNGAKAHYERALKIDEKTYGKNHPEVATDVNNLGGVLRALGDLNGAKSHYERALQIDEKAYGKNHPDVARDVNNLGGVLRALGDLNGAKAHYERALKIDEKTYGKNHPSVATLVNNLGGVLGALGDLEGAKALFERALKIDEKAYGKNHPDVAIDVNNLGSVLEDLGDVKGAKAHFERALKISEATYGKNHPTVATLVNNLGGVLRAMEDLNGAKAHFERALKIFEEYLGKDHPDTKMVRGNLEMVLDELKEKEKG